jgi:hypothetical protein
LYHYPLLEAESAKTVTSLLMLTVRVSCREFI